MATDNIAISHASRNRVRPWIGVGTSGSWTDVDEALYDANLDFNVLSYDGFVQTMSGTNVNGISVLNKQMIPGIKVNIRDDTDEILGVVSDNYGIVQNNDAFHLLDPFIKAGGIIMQAGMTQQGMCFMVMRFTSKNLLGDAYDLYVCMMNSFNAKFPLALFVTPIRVICQNMFRKLIAGNDNMLHIKHGANINKRLMSAKDALEMVNSSWDSFEEACTESSHLLMDQVFMDSWIDQLFPFPKQLGKHEDMVIERVKAMRETFKEEYVMAPDNARFTDVRFGLVNAYYDYLSHRPESRSNSSIDWDQRRLTGLMAGTDVKPKLVDRLIR